MSLKSEVSNWKFSTFLENNNNKFNKNDILNVLAKQDMDEAFQIISKWDNYSPTPLISLNKLLALDEAEELAVPVEEPHSDLITPPAFFSFWSLCGHGVFNKCWCIFKTQCNGLIFWILSKGDTTSAW